MGKSKRLLPVAGSFDFRGRAMNAVRPGVEALLLAAVALGCAQAGWSVLTPGAAGALSPSSADEPEPRLDTIAVQSPFAPDALADGAHAHALEAMLSGVQLNGVRVAADPARSGAMFTLADGAQRAFMIGQEIADGVTLAEVSADYVLLAYDGGRSRLDMAAAPSFSFARAMMGLEPSPGAPSLTLAEAAPAAAPTPAASPASTQAAEQAWLMSALAQVERSGDAVRGWRAPAALPAAARDAGLREGDLIVSVNGAGPADIAQAAAAARSGRVELGVERDGARITLVIEADKRA